MGWIEVLNNTGISQSALFTTDFCLKFAEPPLLKFIPEESCGVKLTDYMVTHLNLSKHLKLQESITYPNCSGFFSFALA